MLTIQIAPLLGQEEEEPIPPPRRAKAGKIGGGGGFTPVWLFWDTEALNEITSVNNSGKFDKSPMLLLGGQGFAYIMLIDNLRLGGMGVGGSTKLTTISSSGDIRRSVEVHIGFGGVTVEYALSLFERLDIVPGILLGSGGMDITISRDHGHLVRWDNLWTEVGRDSSTKDLSRKLQGSFFIYQPSLQIEFALLRWLGLRAGVSYVGMAAPSWKLDEQFDVDDVPPKINGKGWVINTGIFVGTFLF